MDQGQGITRRQFLAGSLAGAAYLAYPKARAPTLTVATTRVPRTGPRAVNVFGDSTAEGLVGGVDPLIDLDPWINLLRTSFGAPALGYCGPWRPEITLSGAWTAVAWSSKLGEAVAAGSRTLPLTTVVGPSTDGFLVEVDATTADAEIMRVTGGNGTSTLKVLRGQCGTSPVAHQAGAPVTNPYDLGPYGLGWSCGGGSENIITWTKPGGYYAPWPVGSMSLYVAAGLTSGAQLSTSVDGGATWQDLTEALDTSSAPMLAPGGFETPLFTSGVTTVMLRAADASEPPVPAAVQGFFGLMPWPGGANAQNSSLIVNNFAKSANFLVLLEGRGPSPFVVEDDGADYLQDVVMTIIGPYTNDAAANWPVPGTFAGVLFSSPSLYQSEIEAVIAHQPGAESLVIGAFEQQGIDAYTCWVTNGSTVVTLLSPATYVSSYLVADGYPSAKVRAFPPYLSTAIDAGRLVFDPSANGYLPAGACIETVLGTSQCIFNVPWSGPTGKHVVIFDGRDIPTQNAFRAAAEAAAKAGGARYLDLYAHWRTFPKAVAAGLMADPLHESQAGHDAIAALVYAKMKSSL